MGQGGKSLLPITFQAVWHTKTPFFTTLCRSLRRRTRPSRQPGDFPRTLTPRAGVPICNKIAHSPGVRHVCADGPALSNAPNTASSVPTASTDPPSLHTGNAAASSPTAPCESAPHTLLSNESYTPAKSAQQETRTEPPKPTIADAPDAPAREPPHTADRQPVCRINPANAADVPCHSGRPQTPLPHQGLPKSVPL